jgi:hypothetical protein
MLYYDENTNLTKCKTYRFFLYKSNINREKTLVVYNIQRYFLIDCKIIYVFEENIENDITSFIQRGGCSTYSRKRLLSQIVYLPMTNCQVFALSYITS